MKPITARGLWLGLSVSALLLSLLGPVSTPAAAQTSYALTFVRKVGASAYRVLALPGGLAFSEGDILKLYTADGSDDLGSLRLSCGIGGLALVGNNIIASTCNGVAVVDITDRADPALVREFPLNNDICPMYDESGILGLAASGDHAYVGLWTSGCSVNWKTGETIADIGDWVTRLQVYRGHLFSIEEGSVYDEEVAVHSALPSAVWEGDIEVQYVTNDFAVAADKVFSTATGPEKDGLCASLWNPDPTLSGARIDCLYHDEAGAFGVAAAADSVRGDNVFTVRLGRLRWVKSAGTADLTEVASAGYAADVHDIGTGGDQYVYVGGSNGLSIFRFQHVQAGPPSPTPSPTPTSPPPGPDPNSSQLIYVPFLQRGP